ncbi:MAG TPA: L-histidine N(alpha)-methyltransferase [Cyclobacteriaceae bacterium]|nr:L-histidine N(alpha)-methyltransferase [Cyclobacteriaceae bacterium]MCB9236418.1 L-histidine N(alpha)-methyltransferase [Flammeovirgaceae bacterium]MCB0499340.1 L-histidine N(alpha)-methyltransferase [Cyclobacteriaceae bacterium]MCO5272263.1 L-histidine N(alpha)-methyltransferase [Cyclobacteriaceae bacterium]MCW5902121.1 L-histidine N(alpha)-methyltransferase [Cyclobacteriaceae bacterium]
MAATETHNTEVLNVIEKGLAGRPKRLPSWLFYDEVGDKIFQDIMRMPEYYLTNSEFDIFDKQKDRILRHITDRDGPFKLVELGAGDGTKTEVLLNSFVHRQVDFTYVPVDVSEAVLSQLVGRLGKSLPGLKVQPKCQFYSEALEGLKRDAHRKLILFLGANIGNFGKEDAMAFTKRLAINMKGQDRLLIGFDLKKDPRLILSAYDDPQGITRRFNLNLLERINREFDGEFDVEQFSHYPYYDPETGVAKSFLVSRQGQEVWIGAIGKSIHFEEWEAIHTEVSQKYDLKMVHSLASRSGLEIVDVIYDKQKYFADVVFKVME